MSVFQLAREDLAGKLTAAGVTGVTMDPRTVPPFVLVGPPNPARAVGVGGWQLTVPVIIASPPPGTNDALIDQLDRLELVIRTLGFVPGDYGRYDPAGKDLPAYTLTYTVTVCNPDC